MQTPDTKRWFPYAKPQPTSAVRLFCLPYAGGSASVFRTWMGLLPPRVEVWAAQPPGRETRFSETAFTRHRDYVSSLLAAIRPMLDKPFVLFGHSMGALMSFELARALRAESLPMPTRIIVSAKQAPHLPSKVENAFALPEPEFVAYLRDLGGTPDEVLANPELRQLLFPLLRRDFELLDRYEHQPEAPLDVPVRAFGGLQDPFIKKEDLEAWSQHTTHFLGHRMFQGGHIYLAEDRGSLLKALQEELPR